MTTFIEANGTPGYLQHKAHHRRSRFFLYVA